MVIRRDFYLEKLIQRKGNGLIKVITGIRRCGKSSLLDLFHQYLLKNGVSEDHIVHMNLESLRYRDLTDYLSFYDYVSGKIQGSGKAAKWYRCMWEQLIPK